MPTFSDPVIAAAPWSISKVGTLEKCTLQYNLKYGPHKIPEITKSTESDLGIAVHRALELALGGIPVHTAFTMVTEEKNLTVSEGETLLTFYDQVDRFVKKMLEWRQKYGVHSDHVFIERKWGMKTDFTKTSFFDKRNGPKEVFFRGVLDYGLITSGAELIIIDHKSGKVRPLDYYTAQFKSYCIMGLAVYPELRGVRTGVNFVMSDQLVWNQYVSAKEIREEYYPWLVAYLESAGVKLTTLPMPNKSPLCDWCGYKSICPAHGGTLSGNQTTH